ncbi:hypothetical protein HNR77_005449 [Paenibacillus sp. JGP012]|nr:hypothetical protein [Paenibacillus sp. JGP012]
MIFINLYKEMMFLKPYDVYFKKRPSEQDIHQVLSYPKETSKSIRIVYPIRLQVMQHR